MIEISVSVCGDHWLNPQQVEQQLRDAPREVPIVIDMNSEGASMTALGITDTILRWVDPARVEVVRWPNSVDPVPFSKRYQYFHSHFFWMAERYWDAIVDHATHQYRFGFFMGRKTWARIRILSDLHKKIQGQCLFSMMRSGPITNDGPHNLESRTAWFDDTEQPVDLDQFTSLDGAGIRDQYNASCNTNASLARFYPKFDIEIVGESYTRGDTYFPTEKTVRPLVLGKSVLVYGPRHFLRNLRDQGFQTWSHYWDESYDELEGPDRWHAMLEQVKILATWDHHRFAEAEYRSICAHNRRQVMRIAERYRPL